MSKIKVNELEAKTENTNVKLAADGTGVLKVKGAGGADGTLKVTSANGTNGVKLKSPAHSAGQSYTLILPDNNIEAEKVLKVKSITGSGATATGQLEYATISSVDVNAINGDDFTTGSVPSSRLPSGFPSASLGAGLELEQKVSSYNSSYMDFLGLDSDSLYLMIGKCHYLSNTSGYISFQRLDISNQPDSQAWWYHGSHNSAGTANYSEFSTDKPNMYAATTERAFGFKCIINTNKNRGFIMGNAMVPGWYGKSEFYHNYGNSNTNGHIAGIRLQPSSGYFSSSGTNFNQVTLYKFRQS